MATAIFGKAAKYPMRPPLAVSTVIFVPSAEVNTALVVVPLASMVPTYEAPEVNGVTAERLVTLFELVLAV